VNGQGNKTGEFVYRVETSSGVRTAMQECSEWNRQQNKGPFLAYKNDVPCPATLWQGWSDPG